MQLMLICIMYPWMPCCNPRHACAVKLELLKFWSLEIYFSELHVTLTKGHVGSGNDIGSSLAVWWNTQSVGYSNHDLLGIKHIERHTVFLNVYNESCQFCSTEDPCCFFKAFKIKADTLAKLTHFAWCK